MRIFDLRAALALAALGFLNSGGALAETATTDSGGFIGVGGSAALGVPTPAHKAPFWSLSGEPELRSSSVVIYDPSDGAVLYERDADTVVPIASITKLMTALVVRDGEQPLDEMIEITAADRDTLRGTGSRLPIGARLSRGDLLHLALMSSENRAANALGRAYPGGLAMFVQVMNAKAKALGMKTARFVEPTGLSSGNVSSAADLVKLVLAASRDPLIREYSVDPSHTVTVRGQPMEFRNSNLLVEKDDWEIALQKTGFTSDAGRCLVMSAYIQERPVVMVLMNSVGKYTRIADARRVRQWMEQPGERTQYASTSTQPGTRTVSMQGEAAGVMTASP